MSDTGNLSTHFDLRAPGGKTIPIPSVGFGTWASGDNSWAEDAILTALQAGYRHLDCAWMYGVDGAIGNAIKRSGIPRKDIFITTKFWPHFGHPDNVELCLDKCMKGMAVDYVDLWLAHWPCVFVPGGSLVEAETGLNKSSQEKGIKTGSNGKPVIDWEHSASHIAELAGHKGSFLPTWKAMQECVRKGKARAIGVSNFTKAELEEILPHENGIPVSCNQVEVHPWLPQNDLLDFCKSHGILVSCYSPFAGQKSDGKTLIKDSKVIDIAKRNEMDVGQLLQSWAVQRKTSPLGKSGTPTRIKTNLAVRKLSDVDMEELNALEIPGGDGRTIRMDWDVPLFSDR